MSGCVNRGDRSHRYRTRKTCFELQKMYIHSEIFKQGGKVDVGLGHQVEERERDRDSTFGLSSKETS